MLTKAHKYKKNRGIIVIPRFHTLAQWEGFELARAFSHRAFLAFIVRFSAFAWYMPAIFSARSFCFKGENKGEKHRSFSPLFYAFCRPVL